MDLNALYDRVGVPIWQHKSEFVSFLKWMREAGVTSVLEIGTGFGGSAYLFGEVTGHGSIVTVDFDQQGAARIDPRRRRKQPNPNFVQIIGDSRTESVARLVSTYAPFDLVYFDTEHAEADVRDNYDRYLPMAKRFIAQHDINMDEVNWPDAGIPKVWREVKAGAGQVVEFVNPAPDKRFPRWGGIGVVYL